MKDVAYTATTLTLEQIAYSVKRVERSDDLLDEL